VKQKLAELLSSAAKLNGAGRPTPARSAPDESFAIPMRDRYLRYGASPVKLAAPPLSSPPVALPSPVSLPGRTLVDLTPRQIKTLSLEAFRVRFEATDVRALSPAHIILIDGDEELSAIAHDVLDRKAREKHAQAPVRASTPEPFAVVGSAEEGVLCIRLPEQLETFVAEQIEAGFYRDAGEVICDSLRFYQAETTIHFLRVALERETTALARARERRACDLDAGA